MTDFMNHWRTFTANVWRRHICLRNFLSLIFLLAAVMMLPGPVRAGNHHPQNHGHADSAASHTMEEMVVTDERISEYIQKNPNQVFTLDQKEIADRNMLSMEEALRSMPGVDVKKSTGLGARISIRGSGKSGGVLVLLNGRPLNSSQYGAVDLSGLAMETIQSITVFKPPVPAWLGAGASEGAINIVTRDDYNNQEKEAKRRTTQIRVDGGSYGHMEGNLSHRINLDSGTVSATAAGTHKDGKRANSDRTSGSASLAWTRKFSNGKDLKLDGRYYTSEYGSTGPVDNPTPDARQEYQKVSLDSRVGGVVSTHGDYGIHLYGDGTDLTDDSQTGIHSTLNSLKWGIKAENNWYDKDNIWELRLSAVFEREDADHTLSGAHHRATAGLGAQMERRWQSLAATAGVRGDHTSDFDLNPGFSAGSSYAVTRHWIAKVNGGYSVNIPNFGQLYQPSHGSIDQVRGNPDLLRERVWAFDAGVEFRPDKQRLFQFTLFRSDTLDPIVYQRGGDLIYRPVNEDRAVRQGIEAVLKYGFKFGVGVDLDFIVQNSRLYRTEKELPYTPRYKLSGTLNYILPPIGTRLEMTLRYSAAQYSETENREAQKIDDYATLDLKAVQPLQFKKVGLEWFLTIENLFDTDFQIHYGYPDDGIRFVSGLNLKI